MVFQPLFIERSNWSIKVIGKINNGYGMIDVDVFFVKRKRIDGMKSMYARINNKKHVMHFYGSEVKAKEDLQEGEVLFFLKNFCDELLDDAFFANYLEELAEGSKKSKKIKFYFFGKAYELDLVRFKKDFLGFLKKYRSNRLKVFFESSESIHVYVERQEECYECGLSAHHLVKVGNIFLPLCNHCYYSKYKKRGG